MKQVLEPLSKVVEVEEEVYVLPTNCWAFDAESRMLILDTEVRRGRKVILAPKVAGG